MKVSLKLTPVSTTGFFSFHILVFLVFASKKVSGVLIVLGRGISNIQVPGAVVASFPCDALLLYSVRLVLCAFHSIFLLEISLNECMFGPVGMRIDA